MQSSSKSFVSISLQDEATLKGRTTLVSLTDVKDGPEDEYCVINKDYYRVNKEHGDFIFDPKSKNFGSINAFGVCSSVMRMYQRTLNNFKDHTTLKKYFQDLTHQVPKLTIFPYKPHNYEKFACYDNHKLHFYSFFSKENPNDLCHTSHSFDIVAHETGHAVLARLRPDFQISKSDLHTAALRESFADCTILFAILDNSALRNELLLKTKGNLEQKSFLPTIAEAFGETFEEEAGKGKNGLRNAQVLTSMDNIGMTNDYHCLSQVFTGAVYDCLAQEFNNRLKEEVPFEPEDQILYKLGKDLREIIIKAFLDAPQVCTYTEMAKFVLNNCSNPGMKKAFEDAFNKRGVLEAKFSKHISYNGTFSICGTS